jgi:hypothetical protein
MRGASRVATRISLRSIRATVPALPYQSRNSVARINPAKRGAMRGSFAGGATPNRATGPALSIKVEFRAEHGGSDECGYAERKRDNRECHGFDHGTLPFILSGNPRLMGNSMPKPRRGFCDGHHTPVDFDAASVAARGACDPLISFIFRAC